MINGYICINNNVFTNNSTKYIINLVLILIGKIITALIVAYFAPNTTLIAETTRSKSLVIKLDPEGKHKPSLNNFSAVPSP